MMNDPEGQLLKEIRRVHHQMPHWVLGLIVTGISAVLAWYVSTLLILLLFAGIIAYLLSSVIRRIEYFGIRRSVAVTAVYIAAFALFVTADILLAPCLRQETKNLTDRLPELTRQAEEAFIGLRAYPFTEELIDKILAGIASPGKIFGNMINITDMFGHAASFAFAVALVPFFVFFILKDWPNMLKKLLGWVPAAYVETTISALSEINILSGNYLRGLTVDCVAVGSIASLGLWMLGINYPVTLGIITGAANVIPYIGPVVSCLAACLIAFIQTQDPGALLPVVLLYTVVKILDDFLIQPLTIGRSVRLHPMLLIITVIAGQKLFGVMGMILAVPAVTILLKVAAIFLGSRKSVAVRAYAVKHSHEIIV